VTLQCKLIQTKRDELVGSVGGKALLSVSEMAELGDSYVITTQDRRPQGPKPIAEQINARVEPKRELPHPMSDPSFPYPVRIMIGGQERKGKCEGNKWLVPVRKDEVFEIHVENNANKLVCMRLLVDGLNWLPEPGERSEDKGLQTFVWGKHVGLEKTRYSSLDPAVSRTFTVQGFALQTGKEGKVRRFVVSDVRGSLAGRRGFTDQAGLITVAFYEPAGPARGRMFVREGEEISVSFNDRDVPIGDLITVVYLQLVDADEVGVNVP
jgi:hypothetical protein